MTFQRFERVAFCVLALLFVLAAAWPRVTSEPFLLPGLRSLGEHPTGLPLSLFYLAAAIWRAIPRWHHHDNMLVLAGFLLCLFLVIGFFVSYTFGLSCLLLCMSLIRAAREVAPNNSFNPTAGVGPVTNQPPGPAAG